MRVHEDRHFEELLTNKSPPSVGDGEGSVRVVGMEFELVDEDNMLAFDFV